MCVALPSERRQRDRVQEWSHRARGTVNGAHTMPGTGDPATATASAAHVARDDHRRDDRDLEIVNSALHGGADEGLQPELVDGVRGTPCEAWRSTRSRWQPRG